VTGTITCTTLPQPSIEDLTLFVNVTVAAQSPQSSVNFSYYYLASHAPPFGPSANATLTVAGGGFLPAFPPLLRLEPVDGGAALTFPGAVSDARLLTFAGVSLAQAPGTASTFYLTVTINGIDYTGTPGTFYTSYFTTAVNASAVSGPSTGDTPVSIAGETRAGLWEALGGGADKRIRLGKGSSTTLRPSRCAWAASTRSTSISPSHWSG
jgi:hypothetical protein